MNGHAADAQFLAGPDDPHRDLPAVGHEDFLEHLSALRLGARLDQEERLAVLDRLGVLHENLDHAPIDVGLDLVHQLHGLDDAKDLAFLHVRAFLHIHVGVRRRRPVEGPHDGRAHSDQAFRGRLGGRRVRRSDREPGSWNGHGHLDRWGRHAGPFAPQADPEPIALDLKVADARVLEHRDQVLQELGVHQGVWTRLGLRRGGLLGGFGGVAFHQARSTYSRVRVSTLTTTPASMYSGTLMVAPLSRIAGFEPPEAVSPRTPGSVFTILRSTKTGSSIPIGVPLWSSSVTVMFSLRRSQPSPRCARSNVNCS